MITMYDRKRTKSTIQRSLYRARRYAQGYGESKRYGARRYAEDQYRWLEGELIIILSELKNL